MTGSRGEIRTQPPRTLVVGIGSPHGDDQAGWLIVKGFAVDSGWTSCSPDFSKVLRSEHDNMKPRHELRHESEPQDSLDHHTVQPSQLQIDEAVSGQMSKMRR